MVSVIIPAYNEEKVLGKCLDAFTVQQTKEKFTVFLVNNNSTDRTAEIAKSYKGKLSLTLLFQKRKGRGAARDTGFRHAKGDIFLSTEADTIVPPDWIETMTRHIRESDAVAVTGGCTIVDCDPYTNVFLNFLQPLTMRLYRLVFGYFWLNGFNFAIYKDVYEKSGGINPNLNTHDDIDLSFRVNKLGKIKYVPNVLVNYSGRRFKHGLVKGLIPYVTAFIDYFFFKREDIHLSDVREDEV